LQQAKEQVMARIACRIAFALCTAALAAWLASAAAMAADATASQVDQSAVQQKVDDIRKAIQSGQDQGASKMVPAQDVIDLCKINPKLPQCAAH
jgi:sensor domain CHASE-containing protein